MSPTLRVAIGLALASALASLLAAFLIFSALDRLRASADEANSDFVLTQLRQSIEASVSLGIALPDIRVAQDLIERGRAANPEIVSIEVFSADGLSLFNTDRGAVGDVISDLWREESSRTQGRWRIEEFGTLVIGEPLLNDFDGAVGGIAVTMSTAGRTDQGARLLTVLVPLTLAITLLIGAVVGGFTYALLRWAGRDFDAVTGAIAGQEQVNPAGLAGVAITTRTHLAARAKELQQIAAQVRALDDGDGWQDHAPAKSDRHGDPTIDPDGERRDSHEGQ